MALKKIKTTCPTCRKDDTWHPDNPAKPFCSPRCKLIDLGEWADGRAIAGDEVLPTVDEEHLDNS